jgi:cation:H+ antiporter
VAQLLVGLGALVAGGKMAEIGAVGIATWAGLSPALIGLTVVAIATSLPEVVTLVVAVRKGHADLAVGNVVGSNLFNILFVLGATAVAGDVQLPPHGWWDLAVMMGITLALVPLVATNGRQVLRWQSGLLLCVWVAAMTWSVLREVLGAPKTG